MRAAAKYEYKGRHRPHVVVAQAVPCDYGPGGHHLVQVVFAQDNTVLAYHVPCAGRLEGDASSRLGGTCCAHLATALAKVLRTGDTEALYQETSLDLVSERVRRAARRASNVREERKEAKRDSGVRRGPYDMRDWLHLMGKWATRTAGLPLAVQLSTNQPDAPLGLFTDGADSGALLVAQRVDGWWCMDERRVRQQAYTVFPHKESKGAGQDSVRRTCLVCGKALRMRSIPTHLKGKGHAEMLQVRTRLAVRFLNRLGKGAR